MAGEIRVASTTDSLQSIDAAAEMSGDTLVQPAERAPESATGETEKPDAFAALRENPEQRGPKVQSTTDSVEAVNEVQAQLDEDAEERADRHRDPYGNRKLRKLTRQIDRLVAQRGALREENARLRGGQPPAISEGQQAEPGADNGADGEQRQQAQPSREQLEQQLRWETAKLQAEAVWPYQLRDARARYPDFQESIEAAGDHHQIPLWSHEAIKMMGNGGEVLYWLSKHLDAADQITQLDREGRGPEAFGILQRISAGLQFGAQYQQPQNGQRPRPVSSVPTPIKPVGGASAVSSTSADPGKMSYQEYKRWYQKTHGTARR